MTKQEFLDTLKIKLSNLPKTEVNERLNFYSEMIDDKIEDGLSEEQAVLEIGTPDKVKDEIIKDIPFYKIAKEKIKPKRKLSWWEVTLIVVSAPVWFSLLISFLAVIFSLFISAYAVTVSLWAVFVSLITLSVCGFLAGIIYLFIKGFFNGGAIIGCSIFLTGLTILFFYACKFLSVAIFKLTKKTLFILKKSLINKENA